MNYSVQTLTTVAECNVLLAKAAKEKADLNFKKLSDERMTARFTETSQQLFADLQSVIAEISATEIVIATLPDGPSKEDAIEKQTRLIYRKFVIETRMEGYGVTALLEKEMDLGRVIQELEEMDLFIQAIETKKEALSQ